MGGRILVVEDDCATRLALCANLRADGHEVIALPDGVEVANTVAESSLDLVILDVLMPHSNGVEALDNIRRIAPDLPVVVCSGAPELEPFVQYGNISAFLAKPIDFDVLRRTVATLVCPS